MADLAAPAPYEAEKSTFLHDRSARPSRPGASPLLSGRRLLGIALSVLCTAGFVALEFQTRGTWNGRRDFAVPVTVPFSAISGVAVGMLLFRTQVLGLLPGFGFLAVALLLTGADIWRGEVVDGSDALRNVLAIITAVFLGLAALAFTVGLVWAEVTQPIKAPQPEA
jgi:hypothetical protein